MDGFICKLMETYDVGIVGLGAMGSAAAFHLARRGVRVIGFDRYHPPHRFGSSHGKSRIIREAYFEHPLYVPLVQRAYTLWRELEAESGDTLLRQTGALMMGLPDGEMVTGALRSARLHGLPHEHLSRDTLQERYPMFRPEAGAEAVFEPRAGMLFPEACIITHLRLAEAHGATFRYEQPVQAWSADDAGVLIETENENIRIGRLLISAGAWITTLVPELDLPLRVERQVMHWFEPHPEAQTDANDWPVYAWEFVQGQFFYGFPLHRGLLKVAFHHGGAKADHPDHIERDVNERDVSELRDVLERFLPDAKGPRNRSCVCLYTNTPDGHFLIDRHPNYPQVWLASPCSGHGFKFASAIGELLACRLTDAEVGFDLSPFRLSRFF